jgi:hypothetical protein
MTSGFARRGWEPKTKVVPRHYAVDRLVWFGAPNLRSCVRQVQQLVMVRMVRFIQVNKQHPFVRSETTIPSSRPAFRQSAARSGSQGCRRERGGTGAKRPVCRTCPTVWG